MALSVLLRGFSPGTAAWWPRTPGPPSWSAWPWQWAGAWGCSGLCPCLLKYVVIWTLWRFYEESDAARLVIPPHSDFRKNIDWIDNNFPREVTRKMISKMSFFISMYVLLGPGSQYCLRGGECPHARSHSSNLQTETATQHIGCGKKNIWCEIGQNIWAIKY